MEIILWRHAEADNNFQNDLERHLTKKGIHQAKLTATWLKQNINFNDYGLFVSEAKRTQETAYYFDKEFKIEKLLNPNYSDAQVLKFLFTTKWEKNLIIVGHQPWIGNLCYKLLQNFSNENTNNNITITKSSIWWFTVQTAIKIESQLKIVVTTNFIQN